MAHARAPFYNTDGAVGKHQKNATDDVMLVQVFLSDLSGVHTIFQWTKPTTPLQVNGVADDNLFAWIRSYQAGVKSSGISPITVDGIVNSVPGAFTSQTTITHTKYTLMYLNNHHQSVFREKYHNLPNDVSVPAALRAALNRSAR
jgi:hypothetical protein